MCGINLIIDKTKTLDDSVIQRMNASIDHRGPDNSDWKQYSHANQRFFLGNTRLQILDLHERANQPMTSENGQYAITFNGEIYNYKTLRNTLIDFGFKFNTESDTEVLLNWLIKFGASGIKSLNGMFAFSFINIEKGTTIIARDQHGMKPLYYSKTNTAFIFSSEIKGIHASNLISKDLNENQIGHYLQYKYAKAPETFFKNIKSVKPGYVVTIDESGWKEAPFFNPINIGENKEVDLEEVEGLIKSALARHLKADTTVGLFLSGGVDSTLLLALAKELEVSLPTFSIAHNASEGSFGTQDAKFARKAAKQFGSSHFEFEVDTSLLSGFQEHIHNMDQPIGDSASLLTDFLSKKAGEHVKTVLSGAGADEWYAGYNRHQAFHYYLKSNVLKGNAKTFKNISSFLPTGKDHAFRKPFQLAKKFLENLDKNPQTTYLNFLSFKYFNLHQQLPESLTETNFKWALDHDRQHYLVEDVLMLGDQWSMRNSIEQRLPFLDNELTAYVDSIEQESLLANGKKWVLKSILNKYGGKEYNQRPKEGFGLPTGKWLHEGNFLEQLNFLNNPHSIIFNYTEKDKIDNLVKTHMLKKQDYSLEIWSVMVLANWLETHFN